MEIKKYLEYSRYRKNKFIKHFYYLYNFFYMIFSGNITKIDIKYIRIYLTFKEYLFAFNRIKTIRWKLYLKKILKKNKKIIFPLDENIAVATTKIIILIKELYNKKFSKNNLSFIGKERKYTTFLPMYFFIKKLKHISFIDNST